jgi:hypothetical protein
MSEEPAQPLDRALQAEAALYGVPYKAYSEMSPRERGMTKAQWAKRMRAEARKRGLDEDEFLSMTEDERTAAREEHPERERPKKKRRKKANGASEVAAKDAPEEDASPPESAPVPTASTTGDRVPPTEADPRRRSQMTIGEISPIGEDLVGVAPPKTLEDIYARWPVGDGQHYLRVERTQPKVWSQVAVAGYLAKIEKPITEEEFQRWFGGKEYLVTLYGPDPKGRHDPHSGLPVIKAKTEPIKITVPLLPPNLAVLPAAKPTKKEEVEMGQSNNPFATLFPGMGGGGVPATPAEATMHRTTTDFMEKLLRRGDEEQRELRRELDKRGNMTDGAWRAMSDSNRAVVDATARAAEARERSLAEQVKAAMDRADRLEEKLERLSQNGSGSTVELVKHLNPREAAAEALASAKDRHADEVRHLRETHAETLRALQESHKEEIGRWKDRERDGEDRHRRKVEDIEKTADKREKELKEEIERVRRDERDVANTRVKETEKRFEDRIRDVKEQHASELRMKDEHSTTRIETQKATLEMAKTNAEERAAAASEEAARARQEAEDAKDPIKVKEKAEGLAEAFGYEKKDENAPQTAGERLAAGVGLGLGKALESAQEWLPNTLKEVAQIRAGGPQRPQPGAPQLPPGVTPEQAAAAAAARAAQARRPRSRAVAWATQGGIPVANAQPTIPASEVGMSGAATAQEPQAAAAPAQPAQPAPAQTAAAPAASAPPPLPPALVQKLNESGVTPEYLASFRQEVEMAVSTGFSPDEFASRFAQAYPEPSKQLIVRFVPTDVFEVIEAMGGADSPILRRDGKKWLETMWEALQDAHEPPAEPQTQPNA